MRIKDGIDDEWMIITNVVDSSHYTVVRDVAGAYSSGANPAWKKGATVVNYKQSGDGGVYMTASDTDAPYLSIFDHTGTPWTSVNTRLRIGNLNGYLGYTQDRYGIAIGEATKFLKYDPVDGLRVAGNITASTIDIGTNAWHVDINGNMWWGTSTTYAGATIKISNVGIANFTGATLTGSVTATSGTIGGWTIGATTLTGSGITLDSSAGSITGGTIQTSSSGARVVLNGTNNRVDFYNSAGTLVSSLQGSLGAMSVKSGSNFYFFNETEFFPLNATNLGGAFTAWNNMTLSGDANVGGDVVADGYVFGSNISGVTLNTGDQDLSGYVLTSSLPSLTSSLGTNASGAHITVSGNAFLRVKSMSGATAAGLSGAQNGAMYYRSDTHELRVMINGSWETIGIL